MNTTNIGHTVDQLLKAARSGDEQTRIAAMRQLLGCPQPVVIVPILGQGMAPRRAVQRDQQYRQVA